MTDYEAYLIARGQLWKQELERFDGAVVAELLRSMRQIRREVEAQIDALDLSSPADLLDKERLERLEAWIDSVTAAASSITEGIAVEAGISSALASATATVVMLNLDGAISAFRDVGLTREQVAVWYSETAELVEGYSLRGLLRGMSAQAKQTVLDSLRTSVTMGESVAKSVDRLLRDAMEVGLEMTERGAVSTVRTAIQAGAVQAMDKVYRGNRDLIAKWRWVAKLDSRTCPQCFPEGTKLYPVGEVLAVTKRPYVGKMVVVTTATGKKLRATPKHPVLTPFGWRALEELRPGDQICDASALDVGEILRDQHVDVPAEASKLFDLFSGLPAFEVHGERTTADAFHGDAGVGDGEVCRIGANRFLKNYVFNPTISEKIPYCRFARHDAGNVALSRLGTLNRIFDRVRSRAFRLSPVFNAVFAKRFKNKRFSKALFIQLFRRKSLLIKLRNFRHFSFTPFASVSFRNIRHDAILNEKAGYSRCRGAVVPCDGTARHSVLVHFDDVIDVFFEFHAVCHVYNLQTSTGLYIANGITVKNCAVLDGQTFDFGKGPSMPLHLRCRCLRQPLLRKNANLGIPDAEIQRLSRNWIEREKGNIDMGGRKILDVQQTDRWFGEWFPHLRPDLQDSILGPTRANAVRNGSISWSDLTDKDGKFRSLKELGLSRIDRRSGKQ